MESEGRVPDAAPWPAGGSDMATLVNEARGGSQSAWNQLVERLSPTGDVPHRRHRLYRSRCRRRQPDRLVAPRGAPRPDRGAARPAGMAVDGHPQRVPARSCRSAAGWSRPTRRTSPTFERPDDAPDLIEELLTTERHTALVDALLELPGPATRPAAPPHRGPTPQLCGDQPSDPASPSAASGRPGPERSSSCASSRALRHLAPPAPDGRTPMNESTPEEQAVLDDLALALRAPTTSTRATARRPRRPSPGARSTTS